MYLSKAETKLIFKDLSKKIEVSRQDPNRWGMSICTIDGQRFSLGDAKDNFCIQSVSKVN